MIARLDEEIAQFKLQLAGMVNQEGRIEEHLVTMVLMMAEIDALRDRIRSTESEIKSVRKSFIQATLENDSNRSGPQLVDLASHEHAHSRDELDVYSARKSPRHVQPTLDVRPPTEEEGEPQLHMPSEPSGVVQMQSEEERALEHRMLQEVESKDRIPSVEVAHSNTEIVQGSAQALHPPPAMLPKASLID